jgi:hypothetical protein
VAGKGATTWRESHGSQRFGEEQKLEPGHMVAGPGGDAAGQESG